MESLTPLFRVNIRFGVIAGVLGSLLMIALFYLKRHPFLIPVYLDFRIILFGIFIFFSLKEYRDSIRDGIMYFWEGMIGSLVFVITFGAVVAIGIIVFSAVETAFLSSYIQLNIEQIRSLPQEVVEKIGKDAVERKIMELPDTNVFALAKLYIFQSFVIGFFISIIISVTLRRQPKN